MYLGGLLSASSQKTICVTEHLPSNVEKRQFLYSGDSVRCVSRQLQGGAHTWSNDDTTDDLHRCQTATCGGRRHVGSGVGSRFRGRVRISVGKLAAVDVILFAVRTPCWVLDVCLFSVFSPLNGSLCLGGVLPGHVGV